METIYTVRQVQEILKVDRITIYRMLQDGRLKGIKIGQQWRFPAPEVERLLTGDPSESQPLPPQAMPDNGFPTHCVQTIQNLFAEIGQLSALVVDMDGDPLTEISHPTTFQHLIHSNNTSLSAFKADWQTFARMAGERSAIFQDHCGFSYVASPIQSQNEQVGAFIAGPFYWQRPDRYEETERITRLAALYRVDLTELQEAILTIPVIPTERRTQVESWPKAASQAIQSILNERTGFIQRLQKIADLTQIS